MPQQMHCWRAKVNGFGTHQQPRSDSRRENTVVACLLKHLLNQRWWWCMCTSKQSIALHTPLSLLVSVCVCVECAPPRPRLLGFIYESSNCRSNCHVNRERLLAKLGSDGLENLIVLYRCFVTPFVLAGAHGQASICCSLSLLVSFFFQKKSDLL